MLWERQSLGALQPSESVLDEEWLVLVWQNTSSWIKCVVDAIVIQVGEARGIDVGKAEETPWEVCGIVMGSEDTAKVRVEQLFGLLPVE